jgi:hypothetical protein
MRKNRSPAEQPATLADPPPAQPAQVEDWRYAPTPPTTDPESGDPVNGIAEDWNQDPPTLPWLIIRCHNCTDLIATRSLKRDVCEGCAYRIRDDFYENRRAQIRRSENRLVTLFRAGTFFRNWAARCRQWVARRSGCADKKPQRPQWGQFENELTRQPMAGSRRE